MAPYHVARSKLFVRERAEKALIHLDIPTIEANIEHTRFPVPEDEQHDSTDDFPGLVRAADLIGQLADINYLRKQAALFNEFREIGVNGKLKYNSVADLRANYPDFFWRTVRPYIGDALRYLRVTQEGQQWIANLYANVFEYQVARVPAGLAALRFRKRLFEICSSPHRIDSPHKAREIPDFTQVAPEQAMRLLQCRFVVAAIDNVRRPRNASILSKLVHAINRHGAPEPTDTIRHAQPSVSAAACETLLLWRVPRLSDDHYL
jgi:hypothetical protein